MFYGSQSLQRSLKAIKKRCWCSLRHRTWGWRAGPDWTDNVHVWAFFFNFLYLHHIFFLKKKNKPNPHKWELEQMIDTCWFTDAQFCSPAFEYLSSQWRGRGDKPTAITGPNLCPILLCYPTTPLCYFWAACVSTGVTSRRITHSHTQSHESKEKATCTVACQRAETCWEQFQDSQYLSVAKVSLTS